MPNLAIQIVHYNTGELLERCLESIFLQETTRDFTVHVLDNSPRDQLAAIRSKWGTRVSFVASGENMGYGKGHNKLAEGRHDTEYILFFNASCRFKTPSDLERLLAFTDRNPHCGAAGPRQVGLDEKRCIDHGELHGWRAWLLGLASYRFSKDHAQPVKVAWVSGAALLIRAKLFRELKGFDPGFFLYREEEDLLQRLRNLGHQVWYVSTVTVMHIVHASGSTYKEFMAPSHRLFCKKHMSPYNPIPRIFEFVMVAGAVETRQLAVRSVSNGGPFHAMAD